MVPELDILERYISGEIDSSEREVLEQMLRDNPMLADAIDGLREVENMDAVRSSLLRLYRINRSRLAGRTKKRDQLSKRKSRVAIMDNQPLFMGIAAGLAILVLSVFLIRKMNKAVPTDIDPVIAQNEAGNSVLPLLPPMRDTSESKENPKEVVPFSDKALRKEEKGPKLIADQTPAKRVVVAPEAKPIVTNVPARKELASNDKEKLVAEMDEVYTEEDEMADISEENAVGASIPKMEEPIATRPSSIEQKSMQLEEVKASSKSKKPGVASNKLFDSLPPAYDTIKIGIYKNNPPAISGEDSIYIDYYGDTYEEEGFDRSKGRLLKAKALTDLMYQGVEALRGENYVLARSKFEEVIASSPQNVTAYFYLGQTELAAANYRAAIRHFRRNLDYPAAPVYEENRWFLSQAYLKADRERPARKLLEEIGASSSPFKSRALSQLKDLE